MSDLYEVTGTYGSCCTVSTILCYAQRNGTWYCVKGSTIVNFTQDSVHTGVNVEALRDSDCFTWDKPIKTLRQLERAVDD